MSKIDLIIDALSISQNSVWSKLNEQALAAARELKAEEQEPDKPLRLSPVYEYGHIHEASQPEQEPVAWIESLEKPQPRCVTNLKYRSVAEVDAGVQYIPLYTATPEQWVELTDSEILEIEQDSKVFDYLIPHLFARSIETKLKEKNT